MSETAAGGLCAGHAMRRDIATSAGRSACFWTWPRGKPWWCCQWQFNKYPLFSHSGALLKSVTSQDRVIQSVPFCQSLLIVQNWVISLWPNGRRDQKSFPLDYLMVLWLGSCLEMSGSFWFLSSKALVWVGLQTSFDLLDTCLSCCTSPKNIWRICSFLFVKSPTKKPILKMPIKSDTTSEVGGRSTSFENSYINPGLQATEQHQDFAGFARGCLQKLNMLTRLGLEWSYLASYWHLKARLQSLRMDLSHLSLDSHRINSCVWLPLQTCFCIHCKETGTFRAWFTWPTLHIYVKLIIIHCLNPCSSATVLPVGVFKIVNNHAVTVVIMVQFEGCQ